MIDATAGAPAAAAAEGVVLVVEDDALLGRALTRLLRSAGHRVELHDRVGALLDRPLPDSPACLVLDLHLPDGSGFDVLDHVEALGESLPAVVITAHGDVPTTVRAMKHGAIELLENSRINTYAFWRLARIRTAEMIGIRPVGYQRQIAAAPSLQADHRQDVTP